MKDPAGAGPGVGPRTMLTVGQTAPGDESDQGKDSSTTLHPQGLSGWEGRDSDPPGSPIEEARSAL